MGTDSGFDVGLGGLVGRPAVGEGTRVGAQPQQGLVGNLAHHAS